jgi:hypothetical protein
MEAKKSSRGRKPIKDKKKTIRIYVRESEIKEMGGEKKVIQKLYSFIQYELDKNT